MPQPRDLLIDPSASPEVLRELWPAMGSAERLEGFEELSTTDALKFFLDLDARDQADLIHTLEPTRRRLWMRMLAPDDAADLLQESSPDEREELLQLLDTAHRKEVTALMAYAEDDAGGLMNPRFARLRPEMTADQAIAYLRRQAIESIETLYYLYVLDQNQVLLGVLSIRELLVAPPQKQMQELMHRDPVVVREETDQEEVGRLFQEHELAAIPVVDGAGVMKGIITVDDVVNVVAEEVTEDIHKLGGMEYIEAPYLQISLGEMIRKRAPWLVILFLGEMMTATALANYEEALSRAIVLSTFIPLIIASGGNSGSQASTLLIRAMVLGEVRGRNWLMVLRREVLTGFMIGLILGAIGFLRVYLWEKLWGIYGPHWAAIGLTIGISLIGVVIWGTIAGSMLPLLLRRVGLDPASASAPFVATIVDVTGIILFFSVAMIMLQGTLL